MNARDPRPENGANILAFAQQVIPGAMLVEFRDDGYWRVITELGDVWKVIPDYEPEGILFEIEVRA